MNIGNRKSLNVLFVTQEDPFYVKEFFDEFLDKCPDFINIKGVIITSTLGKKSFKKLIQQTYNFYGLKGFIKMGFLYIFKKVMERLSKFIPFKKSYSITQMFRRLGIEVQKRNDLNSQAFIEEWKLKDIDVIISVASSIIFKDKLLSLPNWGCINIHHAKLPKYRGMMPNFWQMYNGEKFAGITVHRMNNEIDDGQIILQEEIEILPLETLDSLIKRSKRFGANLMIKALTLINNGDVQYKENLKQESSYFSFPSREDVKEFIRRGRRII